MREGTEVINFVSNSDQWTECISSTQGTQKRRMVRKDKTKQKPKNQTKTKRLNEAPTRDSKTHHPAIC